MQYQPTDLDRLEAEHVDEPMTAEELGAYSSARYRQLLRRGLKHGPAAVQEKIDQLTDEDVRWILLVAISLEVERVRAIVRGTVTAPNN